MILGIKEILLVQYVGIIVFQRCFRGMPDRKAKSSFPRKSLQSVWDTVGPLLADNPIGRSRNIAGNSPTRRASWRWGVFKKLFSRSKNGSTILYHLAAVDFSQLLRFANEIGVWEKESWKSWKRWSGWWRRGPAALRWDLEMWDRAGVKVQGAR